MTDDQRVNGNQGIVAGSVNAQVLAVGANASATQNNLSSVDLEQFRSCVSDLRSAIEHLNVPTNTKTLISKHIDDLAAEAQKPTPDRNRVENILATILSSAKQLGELVTNVTTILGPIAKIAGLLGFVLPL